MIRADDQLADDQLAAELARFRTIEPSAQRVERRVADRVRRHRRRQRGVAAAVIIVVLGAVASVAVAAVDDGGQRVRTGASTPDGQVSSGFDPFTTWSFDPPSGWSFHTWTERCGRRSEGVLITNQSAPLERAGEPAPDAECPYWDPAVLGAADFVGLEVSHDPRSRPFNGAIPSDTRPPLTLGHLELLPDPEGPVPSLRTPVVSGGDPRFTLRVWIGDEATAADRAALDDLLGSMTWDHSSEGDEAQTPEQTAFNRAVDRFHDCMVGRGYDSIGGVLSSDLKPDAGIAAVPFRWKDVDESSPAFRADRSACIDEAES